MKTIDGRIYAIAVLAVCVCLAFVLFGFHVELNKTFGSADNGLAATVASSTAEVVSTTATNIAATSTNCASRVITTTSQAVMLTLSDYAGQTPTQTFGHYQAASTTVAYDGGLYGCGLIKAISGGGASSNVTVTVTK